MPASWMRRTQGPLIKVGQVGPPDPPTSNRLKVDSIVSNTNWSVSLSAIQESGGATSSAPIASPMWVRLGFENPSQPLGGTQYFRIRARLSANANVTVRAKVYQSAPVNWRADLGPKTLTTSWQYLTWSWNASVLTNNAANDLEIVLEVAGSGPANVELDLVEAWISLASSGQELPTPVRTIQIYNANQLAQALSTAEPGDHLVLANGTYSNRISITRSGTANNPIVIRAQNVLGAKLPSGFEYAAGTSHVWIWGIDFKDATGCLLRGTNHVIRRCRFWPKPNYANNGWAMAVTPYNGSDCEISYCELRLHTREEALAENSSLWGTGTQYGVIWNYFSTSGAQSPFYRLKIARCLLTGGPRDVPYNQPNCQFIESDTSPSVGYNTNIDWTIQDCFGNLPRNSTIFDFKARGMKVLRSHIICPTNAAFQLREGRDHRVERSRFGGYIEITRGPGNVIANSAITDIWVMAGVQAYNTFNGNGQGQAKSTIVANCQGNLVVGRQYSGFTYPALDTLVEKHSGSITYGLHQNTTVRPNLQDSGITEASPVTMSASEVGPNAPWVGVG